MDVKIPFYNITNIFLPGLVFTGSCILLFIDKIKVIVNSISELSNTGLEILIIISSIGIAYEVGYIIFRLGAILIEPILKKMFDLAPYERFVAAKKAGAEQSLDMLSREYGYTRTRITLFILLSATTGLNSHWMLMVVCILCVVLFTLTVRGHIQKILTTVETYAIKNSTSQNIP